MKLAVIVILASSVCFPQGAAFGQGRRPEPPAQTQGLDSQNVEGHIITVSRSGEAYAKPDLGILIMSIQSSSPIANEAVAADAQKVKDVETELSGLGFDPTKYQISSVTFGQQGGPRFPGQSELTAYQATQYIYVFFESADLADVAQLTQKSASVIEALRKAGAVPANAGNGFGPITFGAAQGALIIYTVKDPAPYERQALQVAIGRARQAAQDIATGVGVTLADLRNVQSGYLAGTNVVPRTGSSPLEGLKYRWFTTKSDELLIIANATVQYNFN